METPLPFDYCPQPDHVRIALYQMAKGRKQVWLTASLACALGVAAYLAAVYGTGVIPGWVGDSWARAAWVFAPFVVLLSTALMTFARGLGIDPPLDAIKLLSTEQLRELAGLAGTYPAIGSAVACWNKSGVTPTVTDFIACVEYATEADRHDAMQRLSKIGSAA